MMLETPKNGENLWTSVGKNVFHAWNFIQNVTLIYAPKGSQELHLRLPSAAKKLTKNPDRKTDKIPRHTHVPKNGNGNGNMHNFSTRQCLDDNQGKGRERTWSRNLSLSFSFLKLFSKNCSSFSSLWVWVWLRCFFVLGRFLISSGICRTRSESEGNFM